MQDKISTKRKVKCALLNILMYLSAGIICLILLGLIGYILYRGLPHITPQFLTSKPSLIRETVGILPNILNTIYIILVTLVIVIPIGVGAAIYLNEYAENKKVVRIIELATETLSGIPSIIYGLWGFYTLRPIIMALNISPQGSGVLTASLVLAIMIIPYAASLSAEFIKMVPNDLKEGAYSLGATRAEVIRKVVFPVAGSGIFSSYILAIGRALGETMTVTMLIGNTNNIPDSITSTGNSMASIIANQFGEADDLRLSSLIAIGLILFLITAAINMVGKIMIKRARIA